MTAFADILRQYGVPAVLSSGGSQSSLHVFVQPLLTRRTEWTWNEATELGERDNSRFLAFLPPDAMASVGDVLSVGSDAYELLKAEALRGMNGISHVEAVLKRREADYSG